MSAPRFDSFLMVDWSAAGVPTRGANSIWWALHRTGEETRLGNPSTREEAVEAVATLVAEERADGRRVLAGFDFPFGYPAGVAHTLTGRAGWRALWACLADSVSEGPRNASDRFAAAGRMNMAWSDEGPFWGNGEKIDHPGLPRRKPGGFGGALPSEWRAVEGWAKKRGFQPKSVWQLAGAGSVGSQALTGIACLERLRRDPRLADAQVWPFETGLATGDAPVVLAEIYPSLFPASRRGDEPLDAAQVRTVAERFAALDGAGALGALFAGPADLDDGPRRAVVEEEGWILGVGKDTRVGLEASASARPFAPPPSPLDGGDGGASADESASARSRAEVDSKPSLAAEVQPPGPSAPADWRAYERDPARIYAQSFATVRAEARLDRFAPDEAELAVRLIHACGMIDIADALIVSRGAVAAGRAALEAGGAILCDCEAVASGVIRRALPRPDAVFCALNDPRVPALAAERGATRSAAAVELWADRLEGAVVAVGNAPTALFRLLELLDAGAPRPALILGFPVGFVGAAESKAELARRPRGAAFATLPGRRGGSAMASAAVNALTLGLRGNGA